MIRIAIINLMPDTEEYHRELSLSLLKSSKNIELYWVRLKTKNYREQYKKFLESHYHYYDQLTANVNINAIIVTGAPVELMDFTAVSYWSELQSIIQKCSNDNIFMLGICWGALVIGNTLGIRKIPLEKKLFGVFQCDNQASHDEPFCLLPKKLHIPISTRACMNPGDIEQLSAAGKLQIFTTLQPRQHVLLQTPDRRQIMCLGHPEYDAFRLTSEWQRDSASQPDFPPPIGIDLTNITAFWQDHSTAIFSYWFELIKSDRVDSVIPLQQEMLV